MIPREILKKIRQIELRTNRIVTGPRVSAGFNPFEFDGIRNLNHRSIPN